MIDWFISASGRRFNDRTVSSLSTGQMNPPTLQIALLRFYFAVVVFHSVNKKIDRLMNNHLLGQFLSLLIVSLEFNYSRKDIDRDLIMMLFNC